MGFAPRQLFLLLVFAYIYVLLIFSLFLSLLRLGNLFAWKKMKTGYSRFPQAGVPRLDFRCRSNANDGNKLPRTYPVESPPIKKDTQGVYIKGIQPFPASGNFINCSDGIRSATFRLLLVLNFILFWHSFFVTMSLSRRGCKQPFHRLFGRLVISKKTGTLYEPTSNPFESHDWRKKNSDTL